MASRALEAFLHDGACPGSVIFFSAKPFFLLEYEASRVSIIHPSTHRVLTLLQNIAHARTGL